MSNEHASEEKTSDGANYSLSYEYVVVTTEYLREMKAKLVAAPDKEKYMIYRARLFYGNLRRWQKQGLHIQYTSGPGTQDCTCGLVLHENEEHGQERGVVISESVQSLLSGIELEDLHKVKGHVGLPSLKGKTVALIINFNFSDAVRDYLWTVICQECGVCLEKVINREAKAFVKAHNMSCGPAVLGKKGK